MTQKQKSRHSQRHFSKVQKLPNHHVLHIPHLKGYLGNQVPTQEILLSAI